jgi:hypothetical protein
MLPLRGPVLILAFLGLGARVEAGLYYSSESIAELPSQWSGFLLDQRVLRNIAVRPTATLPGSPLRVKYEEAAARLEKAQDQHSLNPEELADLGAIYIRLGETAKAVAVLHAAGRRYPHHFRIQANLGTAWQLQGDLEQAADCLQQAARLAPGKLQKAEELQLRLVRLRQRQPKDAQDLDNLFAVPFTGEQSGFEAGKLARGQSSKLPSDAVALVQQLALWLPADGRLLWQLAELANAGGDVKTAAAIMDGCVTEFGMHAQELKQHRRLLRAAADDWARKNGGAAAQLAHQGHSSGLQARSKRPLLNKLAGAGLPPINPTAVNPLPWDVLAETALDRQSRPTFAKYLEELDGKQISLNGFIQPLGEDLELNTFLLIEYPVGCWYCETPAMTGIVLVELPAGKAARFTRTMIKITGKLSLNSSDPENFLYTIHNARVSGID